jgi:hypothetical protein
MNSQVSGPGWSGIEWVGSWQSTESREDLFTWPDELTANRAGKRAADPDDLGPKVRRNRSLLTFERDTRVHKS